MELYAEDDGTAAEKSILFVTPHQKTTTAIQARLEVWANIYAGKGKGKGKGKSKGKSKVVGEEPHKKDGPSKSRGKGKEAEQEDQEPAPRPKLEDLADPTERKECKACPMEATFAETSRVSSHHAQVYSMELGV